jgi:hypothetical protein
MNQLPAVEDTGSGAVGAPQWRTTTGTTEVVQIIAENITGMHFKLSF